MKPGKQRKHPRNAPKLGPRDSTPRLHSSSFLGLHIWVVVKIMGTLNNRCRIIIGIIGTQKGTIILTTTHLESHEVIPKRNYYGASG